MFRFRRFTDRQPTRTASLDDIAGGMPWVSAIVRRVIVFLQRAETGADCEEKDGKNTQQESSACPADAAVSCIQFLSDAGRASVEQGRGTSSKQSRIRWVFFGSPRTASRADAADS